MIKTVIFDLGGVYYTDGTKIALEVFNSKYNLLVDNVKQVLEGDLGTKYKKGALTEREFWEKAKEHWKINVPNEELSKTWLECYTPIQGTISIVDRLNAAGYELLFLSDNVQERVDYIERKYPFMHKFKGGVFSHVAKVRKPDPKIYEMALTQSSNPANECVYIDDKAELLEPAIKLGMKVIVFENPSQLERKLKESGLKF